MWYFSKNRCDKRNFNKSGKKDVRTMPEPAVCPKIGGSTREGDSPLWKNRPLRGVKSSKKKKGGDISDDSSTRWGGGGGAGVGGKKAKGGGNRRKNIGGKIVLAGQYWGPWRSSRNGDGNKTSTLRKNTNHSVRGPNHQLRVYERWGRGEGVQTGKESGQRAIHQASYERMGYWAQKGRGH